MKNNRKAVEERQANILNTVREEGEVTVEELARDYRISLMTVRRDLKTLEDRRLLHRTHGGAVSFERVHERHDIPTDAVYYRDRISEYAAGFAADGDRLFINGSRTALGILEYAGDKHLSVVTNNGWVIGRELPRGVTVNLTGGELRGHLLIGEQVMRYLLSTKADKAFIGCAAVYDDGEFRYDIPTEIGINESMIERTSGEIYVLADHTKLQRFENRDSAYGSCIYERQITLITDELADTEIVEKLTEKGMRVLRVPA